MGHTDVVPVNPAGWTHDPFGGELIRNRHGQDEVWGRGAVDMLNLTSSMAVVFRSLAIAASARRATSLLRRRRRGGRQRARRALGRRRAPRRDPLRLPPDRERRAPHGSEGHRTVDVTVGEKGVAWRRLRVRGTPGPRVDAVRLRQRAGHRRQGRVAPGRLPAGAPVPRAVARAGRLARPARRHEGRAARRGGDRRPARRPPEPRRAAPPPCVHAHHVLTERGHHRRPAQDERDPRRGRSRHRHPHDARRAHRRGDRPPAGGARRRPVRAARRRDPHGRPASISRTDTPLWDALQRAVNVPFPDAPQPAVLGRVHRLAGLPRARRRVVRRRSVQPGARPGRVQPAASTATTSGSTSRACASPPSCGSAWSST
jgi:hypothetical protein